MKKLMILLMILLIGSFCANAESVLMLDMDGAELGDFAVFDGSDDYVDTGHTLSDTDNWTVQFWVNFIEPERNTNELFTNRDNTEYYINFYLRDSRMRYTIQDNNINLPGSGTNFGPTLNANEWYMVTVVVDNTNDNLKVYVNDNVEQDTTMNGRIPDLTSTMTISRSTSALYGYMDEFRVYERALSVSEVSESYNAGREGSNPVSISNLVGYWDFEGNFNDKSGSSNHGTAYNGAKIYGAHTPTVHGDPEMASGKFDGSIYFDGNGDYLSIPDSDDWDFGSDDFTIDFWVNPASQPASDDGVVNAWSDSGSNGWGIEFYNKPRFFARNGGPSVVDLSTTSAITNNEWTHLAFVRNEDTFKWYINGVEDTSATGSGNIENHGSSLWIGKRPSYGDMEGYIDQLRITKGTARWTSDFTPPSSPHEADEDTVLLMPFDGDESDSNHPVTFHGDADMSASNYKFDGSYYFDGNGDYLSIPDSDDWDFGSDDFTIDFWTYLLSLQHNANFVGMGDVRGDNPNGGFLIGISSDKPRFLLRESGTGDSIVNLFGSSNLVLDQWTHIALVRNGNRTSMYVDGIETSSYDGSYIFTDINNEDFDIGRREGYDYLNGYLDQLRITKGTARWTSDFTPPEIAAVKVVQPSMPAGFSLRDKDGNPVNGFADSLKMQVQENGNKKVEFTVESDVNLSGVTVDADSSRTVVSGLGSAPGVTGTHSLYVGDNDVGVYVCPDADTLAEVSPGCSNEVSFTDADCVSATTRSGIICTIEESMYKVAGLTGSGAGQSSGYNITLASSYPSAVNITDGSDNELTMGTINVDVVGPVKVRKADGTLIARYTLNQNLDLSDAGYDYVEQNITVGTEDIPLNFTVDDSDYNDMELKENIFSADTSYIEICNEKGHYAGETTCTLGDNIFTFNESEINATTSKFQNGNNITVERKTIDGEEYVVASGDLDNNAIQLIDLPPAYIMKKEAKDEQNTDSVPEFSSVGIVLAIMLIAAGGIFLLKRK